MSQRATLTPTNTMNNEITIAVLRDYAAAFAAAAESITRLANSAEASDVSPAEAAAELAETFDTILSLQPE